MTHLYVWHDSFICVTWLIHMCDMTHSHVWHDSFIRVTWRIHTCDMTHPYVWHDSFNVWHDSFISVTYIIHVCHTGCRRPMGCLIFIGHFPQKSSIISGSLAEDDLQLETSYGSWPLCMTHPRVWLDSFMYVIWLICTCGMTHSYVWHNSFVCVTLHNSSGLMFPDYRSWDA